MAGVLRCCPWKLRPGKDPGASAPVADCSQEPEKPKFWTSSAGICVAFWEERERKTALVNSTATVSTSEEPELLGAIPKAAK
uniref:Uncharacterized protein n=1 Tax=Arundo donax TaxID=35708 RepID=A0A0A9D057_ARUDO